MGIDEPRLDRHDEGIPKSDEPKFSQFIGRAASVVALVLASVLLVLLVWRTIDILLVLFLGLLFSVFLRGPTNYLARHTQMSHGIALIAVSSVLVVVFGGLGWLLAPSIAEQAGELREVIPRAFEEFQQWAESSEIGRRVMTQLDNGEMLPSTAALEQLGGAFSSVATLITHALFALFVGAYVAIDPATYKRGIVWLVPSHYRTRTEEILDVLSHQLGWWLIGRMLSMLAVGVLTTIGLWLLGVPLALTIGLISGLVSFVPIIGPIVSVVPAALLALLVSPMHVLYVGALYLGVQGLDNYLVTPIVQHRVVALPHALTLIAEVIAGLLLGLIGVIVATPLAVMLIALINMIYIEDVLGDRTSFTDKIPGTEPADPQRGRERDEYPGPGAEPA